MVRVAFNRAVAGIRRRSVCFVLIPSRFGAPLQVSRVTDDTTISDWFARWEKVRRERQFDLVPGCVGAHYIRDGETSARTVTPDVMSPRSPSAANFCLHTSPVNSTICRTALVRPSSVRIGTKATAMAN